MVSVVPRDESAAQRVRQEAAARTHNVEKVYEEVGIVKKAAKSVRGASSATVWGAALDGARGDVGAPVEKASALAALTLRVVQKGLCSRRLLARVVGTWVHHLSFRRCGLSILSSVFAWTGARCKDPFRVEVLPNKVMDELLVLSVLWPLWRSNLRAGVARTLLCSDATLTMGSVAETSLSVEEATWLYARAPRRGGGVFEGRDAQGDMTFRTSGEPAEDPFLYNWVGSKAFEQICDYNFRRHAHINVQEAVALRTLIKHVANRSDLRHTRIPILLDSRVCQQVVLRGRSSSAKLNSTFLRMCPYLLVGDLYLLPFWVPSEHNPADDGSRGKSLRHCSSLAEVVTEDILKTCTTFSMVADAIREAETAEMGRRGEGSREASASSGGVRGSSSSASSP